MALSCFKSFGTISPLRSVRLLSTIEGLSSSWHVSTRHESGLPSVRTEVIDYNIRLRLIEDKEMKPRPIVLLYGWMLSKTRHLNKYAEIYNQKGFDVLTLQMMPSQVLWPKRALKTVDILLNVLEDPRLDNRPILIHGFSVGGYMHGEMSIKLSQERERYKKVIDRMAGQIFDSVTDFDRAALGFSSVMVKRNINKYLLNKVLETYMYILYRPVTSYFVRSSVAFHENWMRLPSLMLYSKADPIGRAERIAHVMKGWRASNIPVSERSWEGSPHVSHFMWHPEEYVEAIMEFLHSIDMLDKETGQAKIASCH